MKSLEEFAKENNLSGERIETVHSKYFEYCEKQFQAQIDRSSIELKEAMLKVEQLKSKCEFFEKQIKDFSTFMAEQMKINEAVALCKARKK